MQLARVVNCLLVLVHVHGWIDPYRLHRESSLFVARGELSSETVDKGFPYSSPPYLAIITEPDACDSSERMEDTYEAIHRAVLTNRVDLVSIRLSKPVAGQKFNRAVQLTERLMRLSNNNNNNSSSASLSFKVVCSSDLVEVAQQTRADGVHVKEAHLSRIPEIRQSFPYRLLIGTSSHSVKSALSSFATYRPDYYFVGTCFLTTSHPEKSVQELEGPTLPGFVRSALEERFPLSDCPKVLAIGGIDEYNCDQPIGYGSDGVAVIGTVMRADNPGKAVLELSSKMNTALRELSRKP